MKGHFTPHSEETKKKISLAKRGKSWGHHSEESKEKISLAHRGRFLSEETKKKISITNKGRTVWNKGQKGIQTAWNKGIPMREESREKLSLSNKGRQAWNKGNKGYLAGEAHYNWKGGITPLHNAIRNTIEGRIWREHVFQRDDYTCQTCKQPRGGQLSADHIIPFSIIMQTYDIKTMEDAIACDFLWDIRNGRTLCVPCHKKTPTYAGKMQTFRKSI